MNEISGESIYQAHLQTFFLINNYFQKFDNSWIDYFSVVLSCLSIVYGMVSFNVHTLYWETPKFMNIIKILLLIFSTILTQLFYQFINVLIEFIVLFFMYLVLKCILYLWLH